MKYDKFLNFEIVFIKDSHSVMSNDVPKSKKCKIETNYHRSFVMYASKAVRGQMTIKSVLVTSKLSYLVLSIHLPYRHR